MIEFLTNLVAFIVVISILVTVHEYGHYIVGRWTGMKVLRFSVGFGTPIWRRYGKAPDRTEYCVAGIPLGGYVRFLDSRDGTVEPEDEGRAFDQRPIPARIAVLFAGPAFNFLFAIAAYWFLFSGGVSILKPAVGNVEQGSFAAEAGIRPYDKILAVGDTQAVDWDSTIAAMLTEMADTGRIPMTLESESGQVREIVIDVGDERTRLTEPGALWDGIGFRIGGPPVVIGQFAEDGNAISSGLQVGDQIKAVDGQLVDAISLADVIRANANQEVLIDYVRNTRIGSVPVRIGARESGGEVAGYLGIHWNPAPQDYYRHLAYGPLQSLAAAAVKTWDQSIFTVQMLGRIVSGNVSIKNISGPINIAQVAGDSVERGSRYFITILAIISLSLGILNLLPIPVLDGGQIVYQLIEAVKGSPLTERTQILGQQVGIFALLILMSFAFYNDIARILS